MCGIVGFVDKLARPDLPTGRILLTMLDVLSARGPDSSGLALLRDVPINQQEGVWEFRVSSVPQTTRLRDVSLTPLALLGQIGPWYEQGDTTCFSLQAEPWVSPDHVEQALGARPGQVEVLSLGTRLDVVKQVGPPSRLDETYGVSTWRGPAAIGHTRMATESRVDVNHSQPFWIHGLPDHAIAHDGQITNYHRLRRFLEQRGATFYTDNDSELIGVYLRHRMEQHGRSLVEAMTDSIEALDGSFCYLVLAPEGLGVVRDRFALTPLMVAETEAFVAVATEEMAIRRALPGDYRVLEPPPGQALMFALGEPAVVE